MQPNKMSSKSGVVDSDFDTDTHSGVWPVHNDPPECLRAERKPKRDKRGFRILHTGHVNLVRGEQNSFQRELAAAEAWLADKSQFPGATQPLPKARISFERGR